MAANGKKQIIMWFWILVAFVIVGAILGSLSDKDGKGDGCLTGALMGLFQGGSCLINLLFLLGLVILACWMFG